MIGVYNYTVILTYLSLVSASSGIIVSLSGRGHPYLGAFFLLFCGLCDAFDGMIARTKKDRSQMECDFGIQIDSLSDLVAFGVLPACIGAAMMRISPMLPAIGEKCGGAWQRVVGIIMFIVLLLYILAALIRLAHFNVTEEQRQKEENNPRKFYVGLPVTSAALIFPMVMLLQYITKAIDVMPIYFACLIFAGFAFLSQMHIKKLGLKGILGLVAIGAVEFILMLLGIV